MYGVAWDSGANDYHNHLYNPNDALALLVGIEWLDQFSNICYLIVIDNIHEFVKNISTARESWVSYVIRLQNTKITETSTTSFTDACWACLYHETEWLSPFNYSRKLAAERLASNRPYTVWHGTRHEMLSTYWRNETFYLAGFSSAQAVKDNTVISSYKTFGRGVDGEIIRPKVFLHLIY